MGETYFYRVLRVNATVPSERVADFDLKADELKFYFKLHTYRYWTTTQIVEETGVAKVTVYRYINKMEAAGLLEMDSDLGKKQKRRMRWRRKFDEVRITDWGHIFWLKPVGKR